MTHVIPFPQKPRMIIDRKNGSCTLPLPTMQAHVLELCRLHYQFDELWKELVKIAGDMPIQ